MTAPCHFQFLTVGTQSPNTKKERESTKNTVPEVKRKALLEQHFEFMASNKTYRAFLNNPTGAKWRRRRRRPPVELSARSDGG